MGKGPLFSQKMVYKRVRGWTSGRSLPVYNFFEYPPPLSPGEKMLDASRGTQQIRQKILRWFPLCFKSHFGSFVTARKNDLSVLISRRF